MKILLVEPDFPIPAKSKNKCYFLPIGLLKIGSFYKSKGDDVQLLRGLQQKEAINFIPDKIMVTSLFTYWSKYVKDAVAHYRTLFPKTKIEVGGIFASLMPKECKKFTCCDEVKVGLYENGKAENIDIDYSLLEQPIDYQIVHASRGCFRKCNFCGTWKIEPKVTYKKSIVNEIKRRRLIFYDNNLLSNPHIYNILGELSHFRLKGIPVSSECQSGLDGRILLKKPDLAFELKKARFKNPRIAWDGNIKSKELIKEQIEILRSAGYKANCKSSDIFIFMIFNFNLPYKEMCQKLNWCRKWGVLVIDCRYRPLNLLEDSYLPRKKQQEDNEYYVHKGWTDKYIRGFRRKVRRQNIAIRLGLPENRYIEGVERGYVKT